MRRMTPLPAGRGMEDDRWKKERMTIFPAARHAKFHEQGLGILLALNVRYIALDQKSKKKAKKKGSKKENC